MQGQTTPISHTIVTNIQRVRERIATAAARADRAPATIRLMAVSKFHSAANVVTAFEAGITLFGENRVQEALSKAPQLPPGLELHLIGHLQRNKARDAAAIFGACQSIDRAETALELSRRLLLCNRTMRILLEVNTSGEASKFGVTDYAAVRELVERVLPMPSLSLDGLMTIGPLTDNEARVRRAFAALRDFAERLRTEIPGLALPELSMGMSGDLEWGILEGSTMVRVGTAIFGSRSEAL